MSVNTCEKCGKNFTPVVSMAVQNKCEECSNAILARLDAPLDGIAFEPPSVPATKPASDHSTKPPEDHERWVIEDKAAQDFELPTVQAYYGHSLESGLGNCHIAASLVMTALAMESPQLDWRIFTGMQNMADGSRGMHSWLEVEGLVVEVASRISGATDVEVTRNRDGYYEHFRVDVYLTVTLPQWRKWWSTDAGTRWPPREVDLDRLDRFRRKPVRGKFRRAILSACRTMRWDKRTAPSSEEAA